MTPFDYFILILGVTIEYSCSIGIITKITLGSSKERIMEVYLNVAETGNGIFGVEAAAQNYYDRSAAELNTHQAVCIVCVLPNPLVRNPKTVPQKNRSKYNITYRRTEQTPYPFVK